MVGNNFDEAKYKNKLTDNILKEGEKEKSFSNVSVIKQKILANH